MTAANHERVTYTEWEIDPDVTPILRTSRIDGRTPILHHATRRKVMRIASDTNGRKWGSWDWERQA